MLAIVVSIVGTVATVVNTIVGIAGIYVTIKYAKHQNDRPTLDK